MKKKLFETTHGDSYTLLYALWKNIRCRCSCKTHKDYPHYGGRGISVCEEWEDYVTFKDWALSNGYKRGLIIDRKDNNGPYSPKNCAFATIKTSNRNRSNSKYWVVYGKVFESSYKAASFWGVHTKTIRYWCGLCKNAKPRPFCYAIKKY